MSSNKNILYHYTDFAALDGILSNSELRLNNILNMNDAAEMILFMNGLCKAVSGMFRENGDRERAEWTERIFSEEKEQEFDEAMSSAKTGQQDAVGSLLTKGGMVDGIDSATARHEDGAKRNPNGSTAEKADKNEFEEETTEYRLADIFDLKMGKTPSRNNSEYWTNGENKWISIADLTKSDKYISDTKEFLTDKAIEESGITVIPANTVVMSFKLSIGRTAITQEDMYSNEAIMSFRDKNVTELLPDYIYYLLLAQRWDQGANKAVMGMTQNKATLSERKVKIHTIESQKTIVRRLDKIKSIIDSRQLQLDQLDKLTKARFLEMFGDPVDNSNGLPTKKLNELGSIDRGKSKHRPRNAPELLNGPYPLIQTGEVTSAGLYITAYQNTYSEIGLQQSKMWKAGTLCITIAANIAQTAVLTFDACFPDSVVGFISYGEVDVIYMHYWFGFFQKILEVQAPQVAQKNINLKILSELEVIVPPRDMQNEFVAFVRQTDKSKLQ